LVVIKVERFNNPTVLIDSRYKHFLHCWYHGRPWARARSSMVLGLQIFVGIRV